MITLDNYEIWCMDYLDGKLSEEDVQKLLLFLSAYPHLKEQLNALQADLPELGVESDLVSNLNLKKQIHALAGIDEKNYEEWLVAKHENDLDAAQQLRLDAFLNLNPLLKREDDFIGQLKISHNGELFNNKESLKRRPVLISLFRYAAAASFIGFAFVLSWNYLGVQSNSFYANQATFSVPLPSIHKELAHLDNVPSTAEKAMPLYTNHPSENLSEPIREKLIKSELLEEEAQLVGSTAFESDLKKVSPATVSLFSETATKQEELSLKQAFGKVLESGVGKNGVSKSLMDEEKISGGDVVELVAAPFKNAAEPILSTTTSAVTGKRRMKFHLGIFEADFALR